MKQILLFLILAIAGVGIAFATSNAIGVVPQHLGVSNDAPLPCTPANPGNPTAVPPIPKTPASCPSITTNFH